MGGHQADRKRGSLCSYPSSNSFLNLVLLTPLPKYTNFSMSCFKNTLKGNTLSISSYISCSLASGEETQSGEGGREVEK